MSKSKKPRNPAKMSAGSREGSSGWKEVQQVSSLPLQILLFVNVYMSSIWIPVYVNYVYEMLDSFGRIHKILTIIGCVISMPGEILRLHLGYSGNLRARISDMAGFWILSALVQLPIQLYFAFTVDSEWVLTAHLQYVFVGVLILQTIAGGFASNRLSEHYSQQFRIHLISDKDILRRVAWWLDEIYAK